MKSGLPYHTTPLSRCRELRAMGVRGMGLIAAACLLGTATGCTARPAARGAPPALAATVQRSPVPLPAAPVSAGTTVRMLTAQLGLAVTARGAVLQTTDGGRTWHNVTPTGFRVVGPLASVTYVAWLVADDADGRPLLLMTPNGGFSFHARRLPAGISATAVAGLGFTTVDRGWLVVDRHGQYTLYVTDNSGYSWHVPSQAPTSAGRPA